MIVIQLLLVLLFVTQAKSVMNGDVRQEWLDHASWKNRLMLEVGKDRFAWRVVSTRARGECGVMPHAALACAYRRDPWSLYIGRLTLRDRIGILAGCASGMGSLPAPLGDLVRVGFGSASAWQPETDGLVIQRSQGQFRGGLAAAWTARDRSAAGDGFVLGMAHDAEHEERRAKWQERTLLGWLELPEAGSLKPQAAIGFRRDPGGCRLLYEATLQHRTRRTRLELGHGSGEHRLSWCHGDWRPNRILQLRLAIWGGRRGSSRAASSAFSLPEEGVGRGLRCGMSLRVSHLQIECYEQDLRGSAYEEGYRCKRSLSVRLLPGGRSRDPLQLSGSLWSRQDVSGGSLRAVFQIDAQRRLKAGLHWAGVSREATRGFSLQWDQTLPLFDSMELRLYYVRRDAGEYTLYQSVTPWQGALRLESGRSGLDRGGVALCCKVQGVMQYSLTLQSEWRSTESCDELGVIQRSGGFRGCLCLGVSQRKPAR